MKKPGSEQQDFYYQEDMDDSDDIEIIEIIGLDDDAPASAASADEDEAEERAEEQPDPDEIVLEFEADQVGPDVDGSETAEETDRILRLQADFENYKKRVEREREATERHANAGLMTRLLPVLDNFERAVSMLPPNGDVEGSIQHGVVLIFKQLLDELRQEGLTAIDSVGVRFDPHLHDAVATDVQKELPHHTVVEEMQRGYMIHDRVLRPSLVKVNIANPDVPEGELEES